MIRLIILILLMIIQSNVVTFAKDDVSIAKENGSITYVLYPQLEWEAFSEAVAFMNKEYSDKVMMDSLNDAFASGRIIVKVAEDFPDITNFSPVMVVRDMGNHYLLQFLSSGEAEACATYLEQLPFVEYVEADRFVSVDIDLSIVNPLAQY